MRSGVVLLAPSDSKEAGRIFANLHAKKIPALQCTLNDLKEAPETITSFITDNYLERVVVSNLSGASPPEPLQRIIEQAGISRLALSWIDCASLFGGQLPEDAYDSSNMATMVNLARLQHADLIRNAILRTVPGTAKVSRRELFRSLPKVLKVESDIPIVLRDRCKSRSDSCSYCKKACPVGAVSAMEGTVVISDRLCIECGACARECPMGAIQCPSMSDVQIIAMLNALSSGEFETDKRALMLTCQIGFDRLSKESKDKRLGAGFVPVQVPCVASVGSIHHLWSASLGITFLTVCPDTSCSKAVAMHPMHQHAEFSRHMLKNSGKDRSAWIHHIALNTNDSMVDSVSRTVALIHPVDKCGELSISRREAMLDAIRALGTGRDAHIDLSVNSTLPLFDFTVDDVRCTFCGFCQRDCPDHAIEFRKNEHSVSVMFDPALCGGCAICENSCPERAITLSRLGEFSLILESKSTEKVRDENAKCEGCGIDLGSRRSLTVLKRRLAEQGVGEATLQRIGLCNLCKQQATIRPLAQHSTAPSR